MKFATRCLNPRNCLRCIKGLNILMGFRMTFFFKSVRYGESDTLEIFKA
jgi:hypothetical protein